MSDLPEEKRLAFFEEGRMTGEALEAFIDGASHSMARLQQRLSIPRENVLGLMMSYLHADMLKTIANSLVSIATDDPSSEEDGFNGDSSGE